MNSKQTEADYVPYGPEWEKEMSKFPKVQLVKMLGKAYQEKKELKQSLPSKPVGDVEEMAKDKIMKILIDAEQSAHRNVGKGCNYKTYILPKDYQSIVDKIASGYAAAPQKGGLPKLDEPLISQQDLEDYEKMEREEKSPSPSEAGDGWISVEQYLPGREDYYEVKFEDGTIDEKPFRIRYSKNILGFMTESKVAHWRPLLPRQNKLLNTIK